MYSAVLFSLKKEGNSDTLGNTAAIIQKARYYMTPPTHRKLEWGWGTRVGAAGRGLLLMGTEFQVEKIETFWRLAAQPCKRA